MEMVGFSAGTLAQMSKVAATSLSSNTIGQVFVGLMVKGPEVGSASHKVFDKETRNGVVCGGMLVCCGYVWWEVTVIFGGVLSCCYSWNAVAWNSMEFEYGV